MARAEWQRALFCQTPSRATLLSLKLSGPWRTNTVRVHRNHTFEHIASLTPAWNSFHGRTIQWIYSDYDDSLSFDLNEEIRPDVELIWLDTARLRNNMSSDAVVEWVAGRAQALRDRTTSPILVTVADLGAQEVLELQRLLRQTPGIKVGDVTQLLRSSIQEPFDDRLFKPTGSRLTNAATILIARELACHWLPALLSPQRKVIAVDLDDTLYKGTLGEDQSRVLLTESHAELQRSLVRFHETGLLLILLSRNTVADVEQLFSCRRDFPLRLEHFAQVAAGWAPKGQALATACDALNVGVDSAVFVDDNPGELAAMAEGFPEVLTVYASPDAEETRRCLEFLPGLWSWQSSREAGLRHSDLAAHLGRTSLATEFPDRAAYLTSLNVRLTFDLNPPHLVARLYELSQRTNQFNLSLKRLSEAVIARTISEADSFVVAISLSDRLSDSGVVGGVFGRFREGGLDVFEIVISCRALGRHLEDLMMSQALLAAIDARPVQTISFHYASGPRNGPAREWLSRTSGQLLAEGGQVDAPTGLICRRMNDPVAIAVINHGKPKN